MYQVTFLLAAHKAQILKIIFWMLQMVTEPVTSNRPLAHLDLFIYNGQVVVQQWSMLELQEVTCSSL